MRCICRPPISDTLYLLVLNWHFHGIQGTMFCAVEICQATAECLRHGIKVNLGEKWSLYCTRSFPKRRRAEEVKQQSVFLAHARPFDTYNIETDKVKTRFNFDRRVGTILNFQSFLLSKVPSHLKEDGSAATVPHSLNPHPCSVGD